jgi:hypothetical protein
MPDVVTKVKDIVRLIKIKSGQGVTIKFPDDNSTCEFIDKCCMCGHTCKTTVTFDYNHHTIDVVWHKMDGVN